MTAVKDAPPDCPRRAELGDARHALLEPCCDCECLATVEGVLDRMWAYERDAERWDTGDASTAANGSRTDEVATPRA